MSSLTQVETSISSLARTSTRLTGMSIFLRTLLVLDFTTILQDQPSLLLVFPSAKLESFAL
eukprot:2102931-Rhodomonas_salina.1